jgi:hypothetical protein
MEKFHAKVYGNGNNNATPKPIVSEIPMVRRPQRISYHIISMP